MAVKFEIERQIGVISEKSSGWKKELNLVSWNDAKGKYDIREWDPKHEKMGKGVTLSGDELVELYCILQKYFENRDVNKEKTSTISSMDTDWILKLGE